MFEYKETLKQHLVKIFEMGDRDECSWKHLGHAYAATLAFDDWEQAADYVEPWGFGPRGDYKALSNAWRTIKYLVHQIGKPEAVALAYELAQEDSRLFCLANYIGQTWLPYNEALVKQGVIKEENNGKSKND